MDCDRPSFPSMPPDVWSRPVGRTDVLRKLGGWQETTLAWLGSSDASEHLSQPLMDLLRGLIGRGLARGVRVGPHALHAFPVESLRTAAEDPELSVVDILMWRAQLVDFLADVWDTLGPPLFDMAECRVATSVLTPDDATSRCPLCLLPWPTTGINRGRDHYDACPVQIRWRADRAQSRDGPQ